MRSGTVLFLHATAIKDVEKVLDGELDRFLWPSNSIQKPYGEDLFKSHLELNQVCLSFVTEELGPKL